MVIYVKKSKMSDIRQALIGVFQHDRVNERWIATMLYFTRIYSISKRNFERIFPSSPSRVDREQDGPNGNDQAQKSANLGWKPVRFPSLPDSFFYYQTLGTVYMIYVVIRNVVFLNHLSGFLDIGRPAHCLLPGYFFLHPRMGRQTATLLAALHLIWRLIQFLAQRPYFLHMFFFLTLDTQNLETFWRMFSCRSAAQRTFQYESDPATSLAGAKLKKNSREASREHPVECLLKRVLCYRVKLKGEQTCYRLRPNRGPEGRRNLQRVVAMAVLLVGSFFCVLALGIASVIATFNVNDRAFLARYPGCDEHLELLSRSNQLPAWSFSFTPAELYTLLFDIVENIILWGDSGIAVMFVWTTVYLLNFDNQLHQEHLDRKLRRVERQVRCAYLADQEKAMSDLRLRSQHLNKDKLQLLLLLQSESRIEEWATSQIREAPQPIRGRQLPANSMRPHAVVRPRRGVELDGAVHDVQAHFDDFFRELKRTDVLISEVITATICIWLSLFSVMGRYSFDAYVNGRDPVVLQLVVPIEVFTFLIFTSVSSGLLKLHRNCLKSYATLCSLMAYDRSEHKVKFLKLMEFFTLKRYSAYTLFHEYPYTTTTYLSIFSWSLSCLFILEGLTRH